MSGLLKPSEALQPPPGWAPTADLSVRRAAAATQELALPTRLDVKTLMARLSAPLTTTASPPPPGTIERQGFLIGTVRLLVRLDEASELIEMRRIHWLPNAPPLVRGVINLHGMVVPAVDLHERLMGHPRTHETRHMLVLGHGDERVALPLDSMPEIKRFLPAHAVAAPALPALGSWLRGAWRVPGESGDAPPWWDLDVQRFLSSLSK